MESIDFDGLDIPLDFNTSFAESASAFTTPPHISLSPRGGSGEEKDPEDYFDEASDYCVEFITTAEEKLEGVEKKQKAAIMKEVEKVTDEKFLRRLDEVIYDIAVLLAAAKKETLALEFLEKGLPICNTYILKGTYLEKMGEVYYHLGEDSAQEYFEEALQIKKEMGRAQNEETLTLLSRLGYIYTKKKEFMKAMEVLQDSLDIVRYLGNLKREGSILNSIGFIYRRLGMNEQALVYYLHSLQIAREIGYEKGERTVLNVLGKIYFIQGRHKEALEAYLKLLKTEKAPKLRVKILMTVGKIYSKQKKFDQAVECFSEILHTKTHVVKDRKGVGQVLVMMAQVLSNSGQLEKGIECFNQAMDVKRELGDKRGQGKTLNNIACAYCEHEEYDLALQYFNDAVKLFSGIGKKKDECINVNSIARIHFMREDLEKALENYTRVLKLKMEIGKQDLSSTLIDIGSVFFYQKKNDKALEYLEQALTLAKEAGNPSNASLALNYRGKIFELEKEPEKALDAYQKSLRLQRGVEDKKGEIVNLNSMALVHYSMQNFDKTIFCCEKALQIARKIGEKWGESDALFIMGETKWKVKSFVESAELLGAAKRLFVQLKRQSDVLNCKVIEDDIKRKQMSQECEMTAEIEKKIFRKKLADFIFSHEKYNDGVKCILHGFAEIPLVMTLIEEYSKNSLFHGPCGVRRKVTRGEILPASRLPKHRNVISVLHHFVDSISEETVNEDFFGMFGEEYLEVKCGFVVNTLYEESLRSYIVEDQMGDPLSEFSVLLMMKGILDGINHLWSKSIAHRNLNPDTIVLSSKRNPVITNFWCFFDAAGTGWKVTVGQDQLVDNEPLFVSPEATRTEEMEPHDVLDYSKTDVFSAGVIMYWIMTGGRSYPFREGQEKTFESYIPFDNSRTNYSQTLVDLMENMIHCSVDKRLGCVQALKIVKKLANIQDEEQTTKIKKTRSRRGSIAKIIRPTNTASSEKKGEVEEEKGGLKSSSSASDDNLKEQAELLKKKEEEKEAALKRRSEVYSRKKTVKAVGYLLFHKRAGIHNVIPLDVLEKELAIKMQKEWVKEENEGMTLKEWIESEDKYFIFYEEGSEIGGEVGAVALTGLMEKRCKKKAKYDAKIRAAKERQKNYQGEEEEKSKE